MPSGVLPDAGYANRPDVLASDIPSEGTMTARGVTRMYSAVLRHLDGVALVSLRRLAAMAAVTFTGTDQVMGFQTKCAFGYSPDRPGGVPSRPGSTFGMARINGSAAYADIDSGVAVAVMRNRFAASDLTTVARIDRIIAGMGCRVARRGHPLLHRPRRAEGHQSAWQPARDPDNRLQPLGPRAGCRNRG